jgi:predicted amino acid-binding ACT domain protein
MLGNFQVVAVAVAVEAATAQQTIRQGLLALAVVVQVQAQAAFTRRQQELQALHRAGYRAGQAVVEAQAEFRGLPAPIRAAVAAVRGTTSLVARASLGLA